MKSYRIFVILLAIVLGVSLAFNVMLFKVSRFLYLQINALQLDPLNIAAYSPVGPESLTSNPQKLRLVFFGDSRAYQWPEPSGLSRFEFINRGIGGQTSTQVAERFDNHITPLQPDILVVQVCINDLYAIPLLPELKSFIIANCKANLERIVAEALKQDIIVILTTIFPPSELSPARHVLWSGNPDDINEAIEEVNTFIYSLQGERVVILDTASILADKNGVARAEYYSQDFVHLNEAGYEALNRKLISILTELERAKVVNRD
jgi:lysophospholipase L1-like esterase